MHCIVIPTSSASSARVWSVFSLIHRKKQCRLKNETVNKLAHVWINSQMTVEENDEDVNLYYFLQQFNDGEFNCIEEDEKDELGS